MGALLICALIVTPVLSVMPGVTTQLHPSANRVEGQSCLTSAPGSIAMFDVSLN